MHPFGTTAGVIRVKGIVSRETAQLGMIRGEKVALTVFILRLCFLHSSQRFTVVIKSKNI